MLHDWQVCRDGISVVVCSDPGNRIAIGGRDGIVYLMNNKGEETMRTQALGTCVSDIDISSDEQQMVVACDLSAYVYVLRE